MVDNNNVLVPTSSLVTVVPGVQTKTGYMGQINDLVDKQLRDGLAYGIGSMRQMGSHNDWLAIITQAIYDQPPAAVGEAVQAWVSRLQFILSDISEQDHKDYCINEGGFLIRLVERLTRRIQRRWYLSVYGTRIVAATSTARIIPTPNDAITYRRPPLPPSLPPISVPVRLWQLVRSQAKSRLTFSVRADGSPLPLLHSLGLPSRDASHFSPHWPSHFALYSQSTLASFHRLPASSPSHRWQDQHRLCLERPRQSSPLASHAICLWLSRQ